MSIWEPDNLAAAAGGRWLRRPRAPAAGVGIDTRGDLAGRVFVAVRGARHDGHAYLRRAAAAGARVLVVDRRPASCDVDPAAGVLLVDDTRDALARLAAAYRRRLAATTTVVAVTGSCGKTTVKAMLASVLATSGRVRAAPRSFNNEIGVPLSILAAEPVDDYLVLEIGSNHPGEIEALARIARPDVGVITMIGRAHLEGFKTLAGVADEKSALLRHLDGPRVAVVNADAPLLRRRLPPEAGTILFGLAPDADPRLTGRGADGDGGWWIEVNGRRRYGLGAAGPHNAANALAAVAVGRRLEIGDGLIDAGLRAFRPVEMRGSRHEIGGVTVYNDAYNANPDSVLAALDAFAEVAAAAPRRVVVLGDMLELGPGAAGLHGEIGARLGRLGGPDDRIVLVGRLARHARDPAARLLGAARVAVFDAMDDATAGDVARLLEPDDAVLIKGSRAAGLERLVEAIRARP